MRAYREAYEAMRSFMKKATPFAPPESSRCSPDIVLAGLQEPFLSALLSMCEGRSQLDLEGVSHSLDQLTRISPEQGMWIYNLCCTIKQSPKRTLEIGMAYGFSTLFFLAAHRRSGGEQHVAVDPFQDADWHNIGLQKVREVGMEESFRFLPEVSALAVPSLRKEGMRFEVIFVDGNHRFDDALVDFTLCDLVCNKGGYIILDDMWMPSIQKAAGFIDRNRSDYVRVETPIWNIAVYRKIGPDKRDWKHFVDF